MLKVLLTLTLGLSLIGCAGPALTVLANSDISHHQPALLVAAQNADLAEAERLLEHGADVNGQDQWQQTPLVVAVRADHQDMVLFLLNHGADINQPECANCMAMNGAKPRAPICLLCFAQTVDMARLLLAHGAHLQAYKGVGARLDGTALHVAAEVGNLDLASLYLANGADSNSSSAARGETPIFLAVQGNHLAMTEYLIAHGANVNARNQFQRTALYVAKNPELAVALLDAGADINVVDAYGQTPLQYVRASHQRIAGCASQLEGCAKTRNAYAATEDILISHGAHE